LEEIQTKVLRVFLLAIQSHLYSFVLKFLCNFYFFKLTQPLTCFHSVLLSTVKEKGGKPDRKPHSLPYDLRNPHRNLKSENTQDFAQKPQRNCTFMNSASVCGPGSGYTGQGSIVQETENTRVPSSNKESLRTHRSGTYGQGINII
jgi:hypothetical protein